MSSYSCDQCEMEIKNLVCAQCDCELENKTVNKNNKQIQVAECPQCHGMIKSPQCCGHDMTCNR